MKEFVFLSVSLFLSLVLALPVFSSETLSLPCLKPPDEVLSDQRLKAFLSEVHAAVRQRNATALKHLMAPDIKLTFGPPPEAPPEEYLRLANPNSPVWNELQSVLELGGAYPTPSRDHYCIPYTYATFPDDLDPHSHQIVIEPSIAYAEPSINADEVAKLDYVIVRTDFGLPTIVKGDNSKEWTKIYLNEQAAYMPSESLRSPIGYRACFGKRNNEWLITHLLAGD